MFTPMVINLAGFKVNSMDRGSIVSLGPSQQVDLFHSNKRNQGFGEANGDFQNFQFSFNFINDSDGTESNAVKNSLV